MSFLSECFGPRLGASSRYGETSSVSDKDGWFVRMIGGMKTDAGVNVSAHSSLELPAVYAATNRIANPVGRFPITMFRKDANGNAIELTENDHPLATRLGVRPNPFMSSRTLRKTSQAHALLWGNGYIEIERNNAGQAVNLWPLLPWNTKPKREDDKLKIHTTIGGQLFKIDHEDVIHVMDLSQDGYCGMSQIGLARQAIGMAMAMEKFGAKFFANDAKSGGFLMHPGKLGPQAQKNIKGRNGEDKANSSSPAAPLEAQSGLDNAHRVKVLEEGMKYISTTIPPEDAQFLGSRDFQIAEIARIFDVPLILLQSHEKSTSWGSGIEQLMIGFVRQTIDPWVSAWEQELNWKLFTKEEREQGFYVKFNMSAYVRGDMKSRAAFYKELFGMAGITPNQICALEDMPGIGPDGDTRFVPSNFTTLDRAIEGPALPPSLPPAAPVLESDADADEAGDQGDDE